MANEHQTYTFVTVAFEAEFLMLSLQARSMRLYCPVELVHSVIIIDNSKAGGLGKRWGKALLREYGALSDRVQLMRGRDIANVPPADGWYSQQVLKLMTSAFVKSERHVILDAKSYFIFDLQREFLEAPDGRACVNTYSYDQHPLREYFERTLNFIGVDPDPHLRNFTASVPPFIFYTQIVRELIADISTRHGRRFEEIFIERQVTEFFLYTGYLLQRGRLSALYHAHQVFCAIIWEHTANAAECRFRTTDARARQFPLFAVHRRAHCNLDSESRQILAEFLHERRLFTSPFAAEIFLLRLRWQYTAYSGIQSARAVLRRVWRKLKQPLRAKLAV
jgi:hypothetical protein